MSWYLLHFELWFALSACLVTTPFGLLFGKPTSALRNSQAYGRTAEQYANDVGLSGRYA